MFQETIKIPKDRIAVLIGKKGKIRRQIEKLTHIKLRVDSKEGLVEMVAEKSMDLFEAKPVIKAIARGFNPEVAEELCNENCFLEVINIEDYSRNSKKRLMVLKSRCIGESGRAKRMLESLTGTNICIYGKTVAIIGRVEEVDIAKKAIESLLNGSKHGNVYAQIKKRKDELKKMLY